MWHLPMADGTVAVLELKKFCRSPKELNRLLTKKQFASAADYEGSFTAWWNGEKWIGEFARRWITWFEIATDDKQELIKWAEAHWGFMRGEDVPKNLSRPDRMADYADMGTEQLLDVIQSLTEVAS